MNKLLPLLLALSLSIAGCAPATTPESRYCITINSEYPIENELWPSYRAGDEVTIKLATIAGQQYILSVNGEKQPQACIDPDYTYFIFNMPDGDAAISIDAATADAPAAPPPVTITSGGETVVPYHYAAYSLDWHDDHFIAADGPPVDAVLPQLAADGLIPQLRHADDITVKYSENTSYYYTRLFSEAFERIEPPIGHADIGTLSTLGSGMYYTAIVVNEKGRFIEEAGENEYTGWACVFSVLVD